MHTWKLLKISKNSSILNSKYCFKIFFCKVPVDKQFELKCDPCGGIRHLLVRSSTDRTDHTVGGINSDQGLRSRL